MTNRKTRPKPASPPAHGYDAMLSGVAGLLEEARRTSARAVNAIMTATYWEIGRRIVEFEQGGKDRAGYGEELLQRLSDDLAARFGRGFSRQNLQRFRDVYHCYPPARICSTLSGKSSPVHSQGVPAELTIQRGVLIWKTNSHSSKARKSGELFTTTNGGSPSVMCAAYLQTAWMPEHIGGN
jgi:hypothetical protein